METNETPARTNFLKFINWRFIAGLAVGLIIGVAGLGIVSATGALDDDVGEIEDIPAGAISVTDQEARDLVLDAYPGTTVTEVDLDTESAGKYVYDVELDNGQEIMVDARTGEILGAEVDDDDGDDEDDDD